MLSFKMHIYTNSSYQDLKLWDVPGIGECNVRKLKNGNIYTINMLLGQYIYRTHMIIHQNKPKYSFNELLTTLNIHKISIQNCEKAMKYLCKFISKWANDHIDDILPTSNYTIKNVP
jgi:hypothetical protein